MINTQQLRIRDLVNISRNSNNSQYSLTTKKRILNKYGLNNDKILDIKIPKRIIVNSIKQKHQSIFDVKKD